MTRAYRFHTSEHETTWQALERMADEVGARVVVRNGAVMFEGDTILDKLRSTHPGARSVSRSTMTREDFAASLCADAGVPFRRTA
jgi:hypothetical protein